MTHASVKLTLATAQQYVWSWLERTFPEGVRVSREERALRLLEEALEFAQAAGIPAVQAKLLADMVYSKPTGDPDEEVVDALVCVLAAATQANIDLDSDFMEKMRAVYAARPVILAKWQHKRAAGLTSFPPLAPAD